VRQGVAKNRHFEAYENLRIDSCAFTVSLLMKISARPFFKDLTQNVLKLALSYKDLGVADTWTLKPETLFPMKQVVSPIFASCGEVRI
jgi:hypothetical protein